MPSKNYPKNIFEKMELDICLIERGIYNLQREKGGYFPIYDKTHLPKDLANGQAFHTEQGQFCIYYQDTIYCMRTGLKDTLTSPWTPALVGTREIPMYLNVFSGIEGRPWAALAYEVARDLPEFSPLYARQYSGTWFYEFIDNEWVPRFWDKPNHDGAVGWPMSSQYSYPMVGGTEFYGAGPPTGEPIYWVDRAPGEPALGGTPVDITLDAPYYRYHTSAQLSFPGIEDYDIPSGTTQGRTNLLTNFGGLFGPYDSDGAYVYAIYTETRHIFVTYIVGSSPDHWNNNNVNDGDTIAALGGDINYDVVVLRYNPSNENWHEIGRWHDDALELLPRGYAYEAFISESRFGWFDSWISCTEHDPGSPVFTTYEFHNPEYVIDGSAAAYAAWYPPFSYGVIRTAGGPTNSSDNRLIQTKYINGTWVNISAP